MRTRDTDKEKLVYEKAIEQIVKEGFNAFSMNKLAKACKISVATLYIYYKDKDDLIKKVGTTIAKKFFSTVVNDFNPKIAFEEGMWIQWRNRSAFALENPMEVSCFEIMKHSPYADEILKTGELTAFKEYMTEFFENAIKNKELNPVSLDVFWSIAYGPLYTLLGFHREGKSIGGRPFTLTQEIMKETFDLTIKGLKP